MDRLIKKIEEEAYVIENSIIKVDHFINHMLDTDVVFNIGKEFADKFPQATKILTIEASGIAIAVATAFHLNNIPVVFARKTTSLITDKENYTHPVFSFTKKTKRNIIVSKKFLNETDKILIVDDFLAHGEALNGMISVAKQANCDIIGAGIVIEKGFQKGRDRVEDKSIEIYSLANIKSIENNKIIFDGQ